MTRTATCTHTFDIPRYDLPGDDRSDGRRWLLTEDVPGVSDRVWHCAHEPLEGESTCLFHTDPEDRPANADETKAFFSALQTAVDAPTSTESRRRLQFIDAEFTELAFRGRTVGTRLNHAINFAAATIGGSDWTDARFTQPVRFSHATFTGSVTVRDVLFERAAGFRNATFRGSVQLRGTVFCAPATLKHATFLGDAQFWYTTFEAHANFRQAVFEQQAYFMAADFVDYARFSDAKLNGETVFTLAEFGDDADFDGATFGGTHNFHKATFDRRTDFSSVTVSGSLDLSEATFVELRLEPNSGEQRDRCIDFRGCEIDRGTLGQPNDGRVLYDLTDATVGDVEFVGPVRTPIADRVRFVRTRFDGFVFENDDLEPAATGWRLCEVFDATLLPPDSRGDPTTEARRQTFLHAKNGADQTGNETAASAFFYRELTYRRRRHAELARDADLIPRDRLSNAISWLRNGTMMILTGYGERPDRVVYASLLTVFVFAGIYTALLPESTGTTVDRLVYSFQSFVAFIPGSGIAEPDPSVELISSFQAFIGAFFIALFVFTFTRRINR